MPFTTGPYTMLAKLYSTDNEHLMELLNSRIQEIPGVTATETLISLEQSIKKEIPIRKENKDGLACNSPFEGIVIGICTFLIIGLFHPIVVKAEYYWGTRCWWWFLLLGIAGIIGSVLIGDILISTLLGVFSFSSFWTIKEIFEQRERVLKGWFPMNPKRKHEYESRS